MPYKTTYACPACGEELRTVGELTRESPFIAHLEICGVLVPYTSIDTCLRCPCGFYDGHFETIISHIATDHPDWAEFMVTQTLKEF